VVHNSATTTSAIDQIEGPAEATNLDAPTVVAGPSLGDRVANRMGFRPTTGVDEPHLDGLRAVAVIMVVVVHAHIAAGSPTFAVFGHDFSFIPRTGFYGVDLFFVLSGFLLARPWFAAELTGSPRPRLRTFWARRFLRVAPAYFVSIAVVLVLFAPSQVQPASLQGTLGLLNVGSHLLFFHGYLPLATQNFNGANGVYWTLTVEMTFYLLLPFVLPLFTGRRWRITLPVSLALSLFWMYLSENSLGRLVNAMVGSVDPATTASTGVPATVDYMRALLVYWFPAWLFTFALGIGLARMVVLRSLRPPGPRPWWARPGVALAAGGAGVVLLLVAMYQVSLSISDADTIWRVYLQHLPPSVAMALIVYGVSFGPLVLRRPLGWLPLRMIGWTSFGIYLYHLPVLEYLDRHAALSRLSPGWQFVVGTTTVLAIAFVFGLASWLLIERPLLVRGRHRSGRTLALVGVTAAAFLLVVISVSNLFETAPVAAGTSRPASLLAAPLPGTQVPPDGAADATLDDALQRGVMYPIERNLLEPCGPNVGTVVGLGTRLVLVAPDWSVSGTAFGCGDDSRAADVVAQLGNWERSRGFVEVDGPPPDVLPEIGVFYRETDPVTPGYPAQFHVRYVSGSHVVGLVVQARSRAAGEQAVTDLVSAISPQYPLT
jgi:peptidoglycan/LPS O-acetylase OafA/YrhL